MVFITKTFQFVSVLFQFCFNFAGSINDLQHRRLADTDASVPPASYGSRRVETKKTK